MANDATSVCVAMSKAIDKKLHASRNEKEIPKTALALGWKI
jgi:hypothetical protein